MTPSRALTSSTRSSPSIRNTSDASRARTPRPIPTRSPRSAKPSRPLPRRAAWVSQPDTSRSTFPVGAVSAARALGFWPSRCSFCPTRKCAARPATDGASPVRRSPRATTTTTSPRSSITPSRMPWHCLRMFPPRSRGSRRSPMSASAISSSASPPRRSRVARRSASSWRRSWGVAPRGARSTSSTSQPPAYIWRIPRVCLGVLQRLVEAGATVLVVEHNLEVVKTADWVVDLGPEGGAAGGRVIAEGTPEQVAQISDSFTGQGLRTLL